MRAEKARALEIRHVLAGLAQVREVHALFGAWDILLKVNAEPSLEGADILWRISAIPGVVETKWLGVSRIGSDDTPTTRLTEPLRYSEPDAA